MMDIKYAAALFDGEGSIGIYPCGSRYYPYVTVTNGYEPVLRELCENFGGNVYLRKQNGNRKPAYDWKPYRSGIWPFMSQIRPHLTVKAAHVDLVLSTTDSNLKINLQKLKELNKRGIL